MRSVPNIREDRGAAAVEFAILLPLLLLTIFGIVDFGRLLFAQIGLNAASIEGARASALGRASSAVVHVTQTSAPQVARFAGLAAGDITVQQVACPQPANGSITQVTASVPFRWVTPIAVFPGAQDRTLTSTSRMVCVG